MNLSSIQCFKNSIEGLDLSNYSTDELALFASDEKHLLREESTAEIIIRCKNLFKHFNHKYSTMIDKDRMEEIEYDALFRSLKHFKQKQTARFESYFTNQLRLGYIYEYRKLHIENKKEMEKRKEREALRKAGIDTSELDRLDPLEIRTTEDDMRNKLSLEDQDLFFKTLKDQSQDFTYLESELLFLFSGKEKKLVEIFISNSHGYSEKKLNLMEMLDLDVKTNKDGKKIASSQSYIDYKHIINNIKKILVRELGFELISSYEKQVGKQKR